ncbi:MAG: hypothetical protein OEM62_02445 [Acidobacteriota bacterium]|nr:hypothetical protein [Acidobacteriota bacterium]
MSTLGQLLIARNWISERQLQSAIERQQQLGGRLGTCLLELGVITEQLLLQVLSEQLGAPTAGAAELTTISPEALAVLPTKTAVKNRAVPFRMSGNRADIAMLDVGDLTLEDEISFVAGKNVRFYVATELRLVEALSKYYGCDLTPRFSSLALQLSNPRASPKPRTESGRQYGVRGASVDSDIEPAIVRPVVRPQFRATPQQISLTPAERASLSVRREALPTPAPRHEPDTSDEWKAEEIFTSSLIRAETSRDVGEALLNLLASQFVRVLLFRVSGSRQEISGWQAIGPDVDHEWFESYSVGLQQAPVFRRLESDNKLYVGHLDSHPSHQALARCWGGSLDYECLLLPMFVRGRLVCVAYGDRASLGLSDVDQSLAQRCAEKAAIAFERCILRRKLRSV